MATPHVAGRPAYGLPAPALRHHHVRRDVGVAARTGAVNLGQGFPDEDGPPAMLKTAENAIAEGVNQYPPGPGIPALRAGDRRAAAAALRHHLRPRHRGARHRRRDRGHRRRRSSAWSSRASEVLLIEPFYDSYSPVVAMAGCHRVAVPLVDRRPGLRDRRRRDARAIRPRTRVLIVNSPHNPTGMVAT